MWSRVQMETTTTLNLIELNKYFPRLTGQSLNVGPVVGTPAVAADPGQVNGLIGVGVAGSAGADRLNPQTAIMKQQLEDNRALICVTGLMYFPFILYNPFT